MTSFLIFFFSSRRRHTRFSRDWSSDVCSSDLAVLTEQGVGVERDAAIAAKLYRHAAERGQRSAQLRWGLALMEGRDVEQDVVLGESWLRRAALAGDPDAAALVGDLYVKNGRLPPNYPEAATWYRRAAEAGHTAAAR